MKTKIVKFDNDIIIRLIVAYLRDNHQKGNTVEVLASILERSEFLAPYVANGLITLKTTNGKRLPTWGYLSQLIARTPVNERDDLFVEVAIDW